MKKLTLFVACILVSLFVFSQSGTTYTEFINNFEKYWVKTPELKAMQGTGYKQYLRFNSILERRYDENGSMTGYCNAVKNYSNSMNFNSVNSTNTNANWNYLGPFDIPPDPSTQYQSGKGWIWSVAIDPNDHNRIYVGAHQGGVWRTTNGGVSWMPLTDSYSEINGIPSIAVDWGGNQADGSDIIYITSTTTDEGFYGYSFGIFKSVDNGGSWNSINDDIKYTDAGGEHNAFPATFLRNIPRKIILHPTQKNILYLITYDNIYKTTDYGNTWDNIKSDSFWWWWPDDNHTNGLEFGWYDIEVSIDAQDNEVVYVTGHKIIKSSDGGATWSDITLSVTGYSQIERCETAVDNDNFPSSVYFYSVGSVKNIIKCVSNSDTPLFTYVIGDIGASKAKMEIEISPTDVINGEPTLYLGGLQVYRFNNNYSTTDKLFKISSRYQAGNLNGPGYWIHDDIRDLKVIKENNTDKIYVGNDGGLSWGTFTGNCDNLAFFQCYDNCWCWYNISGGQNGLHTNDFFGLDGVESNPDLLLGGLQDVSVFVYNSQNINKWTHSSLGDGAKGVIINYNDPAYMFEVDYCNPVPSPQGRILRSTNGGVSFGWQFDFRAHANSPLEIHPTNPDILFLGERSEKNDDGIQLGANLYRFNDCNTTTTNFWSSDKNVITPTGNDNSLTAVAASTSNPEILYVGNDKSYLWDWSTPATSYNKCIWRTINGITSISPTWFDITSGLTGLSQGYITDIEVNPDNSGEIWVTFSLATAVPKVYHGTWDISEPGMIWNEFAQGLPSAIPVNEIKYDKINKTLYVATDVGVFYRSSDMNQWEQFNEGLPLKLVTDLVINSCAGKIRASIFGRGIWESPLKVKELNTSTTWNTSRNISSDLIIKQGATLTISGNTTIITVSKDKKIIVEPGATLIVNGAKITSNTTCGNYMWQGIEVQGNNALSQNTIPCPMGIVDLKNGAIIENALEAVRTVKTNTDGTTDWSGFGGIIYANGATFRNCRNGIWIVSYHNTLTNGIIASNKSYILNCTFETTANLLDPTQNPYEFIGLWAVEGIRIEGNTFQNTNPVIGSWDSRGNGIMIYDARCNITDLCLSNTTPCTNSKPNTFFRLNYAISVNPSNSLNGIIISRNEFNYNRFSIMVKGVKNSVITSNKINSYIYGLYIENSRGFKIEDNEFYSTYNGYNACVISGSGATSNVIYKNRFHDIKVGIQAQNSFVGNQNDGLQIKCNNFMSNIPHYDIVIASGAVGNPQGICGSLASPANNMFSASSMRSIFVNQGVTPFTYNYYQTTFNTMPHNVSSAVTPVSCSPLSGQWVYNTVCPSTIGNGINPDPNPNVLIARIASGNSQINVLSSKIDGGSTQTLLNKINSNMSPGQLKNALLAPGPYLSDPVLIAAINRINPLPPGILKEIIVPNSPLTTNVMAVLNTKNLPAGIKADIQAVQTGTSARTILEQQILELKQQKELSTAELMRYYLNNSVTKIDSVIIFLKTQTDLDSKWQLVQAYLLKQDCSNATTLINQLPQQTTEDIAFKQFYTIMANLCTQGKTIFELTPAQKTIIYSIVATNTSTATAAKSVLSLVYGEIYPEIIEEIIVPDNQTLRGYLFNNPSCNNSVTEPVEVPNDTIVLLDSTLQVAEPLTQAITDNQGYFKFKYNDLIYLDNKVKYTFGTQSGAVIQDTIFKTIQQWISASPVNLNLKKLKADFVNDTVKCFDDTVHFTNKIMFGKKPYTFSWSFAFHVGSTLANPVHKYSSAGIYNTSLIATDALGCKDTVIKQIIIPACPGIYGFINEHADCGGMPIINDTIFVTDEFENIYDTIFAVTNSTGQFAFNPSMIDKLDTNINYGFKLKSGYGIGHLQYNTISYWKNSSPHIFETNHRAYWSRDFNMSDSAICSSTSIDISRNIYVAGTAYYPYLKTDYMLIKYNPVGDELWHISYNPTGFGNYSLTDMKNDNSGNCILTGSGDEGTITVKINPDGIIEWSNTWTDDNYFGEDGYLAIDTLNNIYLASNISDGSGLNNFALTKFNISGQKLWSTIYNSNSLHLQKNIIDKAGNIILLCLNQNTNSSYIFKYNSSGTLIWSAYNTNSLLNIAVGNDNSVYATGNTLSNPADFFTVKYDVNGNYQWSQTYRYSEYIGKNYANQIIVDKDGNIIVAGISPSFTTISPPLIIHLNCYSFVKYAPDGSELWNTVLAIKDLFSSPFIISSIVTDKIGNIYTAGSKKIYPIPPWSKLDKPYYQFLTTKLNTNGDMEWIESPYTTKYNSSYLSDLIVSDNENVYVTGTTALNGVRSIKYVQCPLQANNARYGNPANNTESFDNKTQILNSNSQILNQSVYVNMFPNPNDGNFYFNYSLPENEKCQFTVFDPTSKKVYSIEIKGGKNTVMINHNNFSNGVYYYQVTAGNRLIKTERLVIAK